VFHVKHRGPGRTDPTSAIARLAGRYALESEAADRLDVLLRLLTKDPAAPTAVRDPQAALNDHIADSLVALELDEVRHAVAIADLGAGAGLPGIPLAVALPGSEVSLVESNRRKCEFIQRAIATCGLTNAAAVTVRAEEWGEGFERFDLVTARAVAPLSVVAEYAAPLLRIGGALLAWKGRIDHTDQAAALVAADELGLELGPPWAVEPYPGVTNRHLQLMRKVAPTPGRFPRRPGMARKRPLGAGASRPSDR
jgi:16S rRNA (guanine527-N7)-methyltransferase